jgi:hypothetical protein
MISYYLSRDSLLNLSNITSKIHTVAVSVIFYLQIIFHNNLQVCLYFIFVPNFTYKIPTVH